MIRKIKFRGKRVDNGEWIYGDLIENQGRYFIYHAASETTIDDNDNDINIVAVKVVPNTVGQFTGLTDCNGKEIYEDDIITFDDRPYNAYGTAYTGSVTMYKGAWCCFFWDAYFEVSHYPHLYADDFASRKTRIVDTIYHNLKLLKGGENG